MLAVTICTVMPYHFCAFLGTLSLKCLRSFVLAEDPRDYGVSDHLRSSTSLADSVGGAVTVRYVGIPCFGMIKISSCS